LQQRSRDALDGRRRPDEGRLGGACVDDDEVHGARKLGSGGIDHDERYVERAHRHGDDEHGSYAALFGCLDCCELGELDVWDVFALRLELVIHCRQLSWLDLGSELYGLDLLVARDHEQRARRRNAA
jgi:hypothetical protein